MLNINACTAYDAGSCKSCKYVQYKYMQNKYMQNKYMQIHANTCNTCKYMQIHANTCKYMQYKYMQYMQIYMQQYMLNIHACTVRKVFSSKKVFISIPKLSKYSRNSPEKFRNCPNSKQYRRGSSLFTLRAGLARLSTWQEFSHAAKTQAGVRV